MKPRVAITIGPEELAQRNTRETYRLAVEQAGGEPVLLSPVTPDRVLAALLEYDGLLIPGGRDVNPEIYGGSSHPAVQRVHPALDEFEIEAARAAKRSGLPTLAICRGMQVVNVALGGTLYEDIDDQYESPNGLRVKHKQTPDFSRKDVTHEIDVRVDSALGSILEVAAVRTNTLHHQAVRRVAHDLHIVARARDGTVEALELRGEHPFFVAVQWHPEELADRDEPSRRLFRAFVGAAARRAAGRPQSPAAH
jgi:putative glutamine amidotransferase